MLHTKISDQVPCNDNYLYLHVHQRYRPFVHIRLVWIKMASFTGIRHLAATCEPPWGQESFVPPGFSELNQFLLAYGAAWSVKKENCKLKLHLWIDFLISNIGSSIPPGPGLSVSLLSSVSDSGQAKAVIASDNSVSIPRVKRYRSLDQRFFLSRIQLMAITECTLVIRDAPLRLRYQLWSSDRRRKMHSSPENWPTLENWPSDYTLHSELRDALTLQYCLLLLWY